MKKTVHRWEVPHENHFLLKSETILLAVLVFVIAVFSFAIFSGNWTATILSAAVFAAVFLVVTCFLRRMYPVKEHYHLTASGLTIESRSGKKKSKKQILFKDITKFKLDKFLHGGRIETKSKRHPIYFNTRKEVERLERFLKKKIRF